MPQLLPPSPPPPPSWPLLQEAWEGVLHSTTDVKELIPEFYMGGSGDFLVNAKRLPLGLRQSGRCVCVWGGGRGGGGWAGRGRGGGEWGGGGLGGRVECGVACVHGYVAGVGRRRRVWG